MSDGWIVFVKVGHEFKFKDASYDFDNGSVTWTVEIDNRPSGTAEWVIDPKNGSFFSFNPPLNVNGKNTRGIKPLPEQVQLIDQIVKKIKEDANKEKQRLIDEFKKNPPEKIYIGIGGDSGKLYVALFDEELNKIKSSKEYKDWMKLMEEALRKIYFSSPSLEEFKRKLSIQKSDIQTALYNVLYDDGSWGVIDLNNNIVQNTIKEIEDEKIRLIKQKERENNEAIEKAKKLHKEIYIRKIDFYESEGEEGIVQVWEVATPDGEIIKKYIPTYL